MKNKVGKTFLLLLLLQSCQVTKVPQGLEVKVVRVVSGQTLEVTGMDKQPARATRVRLMGIEAPDLRQQPWGPIAKEQLKAMAEGRIVLLELDMQAKDPFGRRLAYVWQDGLLLNEQLVAAGYVLATHGQVESKLNHKYNQRLVRAQERARLMEQGIWNPQKPMRLTPSEFRSQNR